MEKPVPKFGITALGSDFENSRCIAHEIHPARSSKVGQPGFYAGLL